MDATRTATGFTLIELLTVMAIGAIILMLGAPTFGRLAAQVQTRAAEAQITRALQHARHAAIMRGSRVLMCPSTDGQHCKAGFAWHAGWLVALDADHDGEPDADHPALVIGHAVAADLRVVTSAGRGKIVFRADGSAPGSNASFTICHGPQAIGAAVIVSNAGRVRTAEPDASHLAECLAVAR